MKHLMIIAAVVLICQSAKVSQEVTHQVTAVVPSSVLTPPDTSKDTAKFVTNAKVLEVSKDHNTATDNSEKVVPVVQTGVKATVMPAVEEMKRKTRAVMATGQPMVMPMVKEVTSVTEKITKNYPKTIVTTTMEADQKTIVPSMMEMKRKTRAVMTTVMPDIKTMQPTKQVPQVDTKLLIMTTVQPESKTVIPTGTETKRKTRSVMTTGQSEVKAMKPSDQISQEDKKKQPVMAAMTEVIRKTRAVMVTEQPEVKTMKPTKQVPPKDMSSVDELMRKVRAVMNTVQPEVKTATNPTVQEKTTVIDPVVKVDTKTVIMTTMKPETKTVTTPVKELKRKTRAVVATELNTKKPNVQVSQKDTKTEQPEMKTVMPAVTEMKRKTRSVMTTMKPEMKKVEVSTVQQPITIVDSKAVVMTTMQPETKTVMTTVNEMQRKTRNVMTAGQPNKQISLEVSKTIGMTTIQPETKTVMPTIKETKRKTRAVPFQDNDSKRAHKSQDNDKKPWNAQWVSHDHSAVNKMHSHRARRSVKVETTTLKPDSPVQTTHVNEKEVVKTSNSAPIKSNPKSSIDPCDLLCTKFEFEPICASNGLCLHEFPNQCILDTFNCKHPKGKFAATKDDSCQMSWLTKCEESDMI